MKLMIDFEMTRKLALRLKKTHSKNMYQNFNRNVFGKRIARILVTETMVSFGMGVNKQHLSQKIAPRACTLSR
jgi:hypothetical protein